MKKIEDLIEELNNAIEDIDSHEEQKSVKEKINLIIYAMTMEPEQLKGVKQKLQEDNSIDINLKNNFIQLIDERVQLLELESMTPAQRKAYKFMELANTEDEQEWKMLNEKLGSEKYELTINNGPFGILDYGKNKNGELGIGLRKSVRDFSNQKVFIPEEELEDIFCKSNMEILSMFNEEVDKIRNPLSLRALYLIDCLREKGISFEKEFYEYTDPTGYMDLTLENGKKLKYDGMYLSLGEAICEKDATVTLLENEGSEIETIFVESMEKFPEIIKQVKDGTYHLNKDKSERSKIEVNDLQQRETVLSSLEAEEKTISEAEILRDIQNQKQGEQK